MRKLTLGRTAVIAAHALVGWALCFATIGIGLALTTLQTTLVVHAIAAPPAGPMVPRPPGQPAIPPIVRLRHRVRGNT